MKMKEIILILFIIIYTSDGAKPKARIGLENSPLSIVQALEFHKVTLPCDVDPPIADDDTILVLFYRGAVGTPIYSIDGRNGPVRQSHHWSDEDTLGDRAYFDLSSVPTGLVINPTKSSDSDIYRCRTDFRSSPTKNVRVKLQIIVPAKKMRIVTDKGVDVSGVIGAYPVGSSLTLQCKVEGGVPRPHLTWWNGNTLLDDRSEEKLEGVTINTLTLHSLSRADLYKELTCRASNTNISESLAASVTLDMSFPPLDVRIHRDSNVAFSEGERYKIICESSGSRPTATITWWKNSVLMTDSRTQVFQEGNVSRSTLHLMPSLSDDGAHIACRAKNPRVPSAVMEDSIKLKVHYTPRLSLAAGQNLDMEDIKEGDDVYFECGILANPKVFKVQWFHNGEEILHNVNEGVIQSNQSLVLQRVTKSSSGQYTCAASNLHGSSSSNAVQLSVKFTPLCRPGQKTVYGAGKEEELNITCSIEAHPEPTLYRWAFNTSSEVMDLPSDRTWVVGKGRSQASYTPHSHQDYGSLLCWAQNDVGMQLLPCIYHIIHAAPPDPVNNCTVGNISAVGADVQCQAGWDGGLSQTFTLSVSHAQGQTRGQDKKEDAPRVLANTSTSPKPHFNLSGLEPGTKYILTINGVNKKGVSEAVRLAIFTLNDKAEKRTSPVTGEGMAMTSLVGAALGVVASLLLMCIVILVVIRSRKGHPQKQEAKMVYNKASGGDAGSSGVCTAAKANKGEEIGSIGIEDPSNPDVIPVNNEYQISPQVTIQQAQQQMNIQSGGVGVDHQQQEQRPVELYGEPKPQVGQITDYLQGHNGSFYINPGTLMNQGPGVFPAESDQMNLVGCPLAASTPTAITSPSGQIIYTCHEPPLQTLSRVPAPYVPNAAGTGVPFYANPLTSPVSQYPTHYEQNQPTTPSYNPDMGFVPISSTYSHEYPVTKPYTSNLETLPPCYAEYNLTLGRSNRAGIACTSSLNTNQEGGHQAPNFSTATVCNPPPGAGCSSQNNKCSSEVISDCRQQDTSGDSIWAQDSQREASSPTHRESSV